MSIDNIAVECPTAEAKYCSRAMAAMQLLGKLGERRGCYLEC
jgi:hypothetical protein